MYKQNMKTKEETKTIAVYLSGKWLPLCEMVKAEADREELHVSQYIRRCLAEKLNFHPTNAANQS